MAENKYTLVYFNGRGSGEVSRLLLSAAGQPFEDKRIERADWPTLKASGETPFGQLPYLIVTKPDGQQFKLAQSNAIERYIARKFGLLGKDEFEEAKVDMYREYMRDMQYAMMKVLFTPDETAKAEGKTNLKEKTFPETLTKINEILGEGICEYFVDSGLSAADISLFASLEFIASLFYDGDIEKASGGSAYPNIAKLREGIKGNPRIAEWLKSRPVTEH